MNLIKRLEIGKVKNTLQVRRRYRNRGYSQAVTILKKEDGYFFGDNEIKYNPQGVAIEKGASWDLMYQDEDGVHKMLHALGISYSKSGKEVQPYTNYKPKLVSQRNHYQASNDDDLEKLVTLGYATKSEALNLNYYFVTTEGMEYLRGMGYRFEDRNK